MFEVKSTVTVVAVLREGGAQISGAFDPETVAPKHLSSPG